MKMSNHDALAKFGSYLSVQIGDYDVISENLGSYEEARKNHTVGDDRPYEWYFPNTDAGLAAAKEWALNERIVRRHDCKFHGIEFRQAVMENRITKIRMLRAKVLRDKKYLKTAEDYKAETASMIAANESDTDDNVEISLIKDELELGLVLDIGAKIWFVTNDYGGVEVHEYKVTSHSVYGCSGDVWTSDGLTKAKVDIIIHSNYGDGDGNAKGYIENNQDQNKTGYVNQKCFTKKHGALEQARVWAQEIVDKNSKWL